MTKLWGGRFQKQTAIEVEQFNSSIGFDQRLYKEDIQGSIAHARMLGEQGIILKEESSQLIEGLKKIQQMIEALQHKAKSTVNAMETSTRTTQSLEGHGTT